MVANPGFHIHVDIYGRRIQFNEYKDPFRLSSLSYEEVKKLRNELTKGINRIDTYDKKQANRYKKFCKQFKERE